MAQPNYRQVERLLLDLQPFRHAHSMRAERTAEAYEVFSYSTLIATYTFASGEWWINPNKYSVTTSKQQNIIRRVAGVGVPSKSLTPTFP